MLSAHFDGSCPGIQSICHPLAIHLPVSLPLPLGHRRCSGSCWISIPIVALTHWECFLFLKKKTAVVLAPRLAVVFRQLLCLGSFPVCLRVGNVTPIPKGPPSSSASNCRPISLTPILANVFELMSVGKADITDARRYICLVEII